MIRFSLTVLLCILSLPAFGAEPPPFKPGEAIYYKIHKLGLRGEATLVYKGPSSVGRKKALLIIFTSRAFNFYDQERIYVDPETFQPIRVDRDLDIFGKREKITEDYSEGRIQITKIDGKGRKSQQTIETKHKVDNIYGFIYRYRLHGSFKEGEVLDMHLPTKDLTLKLVRKEQVEAAKKSFDSYYMESEPSEYKVWFDAGPNKLPLRISGAAGFGDTVMIMKSRRE